MDFGYHPGKDRMPREAAMAGCCLITGIKGSAGNAIDVSIPAKYKLDAEQPDFPVRWKKLADEIFGNFAAASADFADYRNSIREEKDIFEAEVKQFVRQVQKI